MNKTEILNIVNEPSKHIHIVKIDGKDTIVYSSKFVDLLELIPTMLTKDDMVAILEDLLMEIEGLKVNTNITQTEFSCDGPARFYNKGIRATTNKIQQKINSLKEI